MIGTTFSHFRITEELGRGGMGVVYAGEDTKLGRRVAVKVLSPEVAGDEERMRRFVREAQAASVINHPNIATIYEIDEFQGTTFIAMEFVEGETLGAKVKDGPMEFGEILDLARQIAGALGSAHALGIVHRDIKPDNIIVRNDGLVKILDFGLAKLMPGADGPGSAESVTLTAEGVIMGTAQYMSPEQARGEMVDARSDVFSVGAVLYEMATGNRAFPGQSHFEVLYSVVNESPEPIPEDSAIPPAFREIVARTLAKTATDRYQDCAALAEELAAITTEEAAAEAPRPGAPPSEKVWETATGVITVTTEEPRGAEPANSIAVLPFRNMSGSPDADWMRTGLQMMLSSDLARVASLRVVPPDRLTSLLTDLKLGPDSTFDDVTMKSVGEFLSVETIVTGSFVKLGPASRVDVTIRRPSTGEEAHVKSEAKDEADLLSVVAHLAAEVQRSVVGDRQRDLVTTMVGERGSGDPDAVRAYVDGLSMLHQGNNLEAINLLERAVEKDTDFALAYTYLGEALANAGREEEARASLGKAVERTRGLSRPDKVFVTAREAMIAGEIPRAIEAFETLTELLPNNLGAFFELAQAYELEGKWDGAIKNLERVIGLDPKFVAALFALGRVHIKKGSYNEALDSLYRALSLNVLLENQEGRATVLNAIGLAHFWLDKYDDALKHYHESLEIKKAIGDTRGVGATLSNIAILYQVRGDYERSVQTYQEALAISEEMRDEQGTAENLINIGTVYEEQGQLDDALSSYKRALKIESDHGDRQAEILCLNDIGNVYLTQGKIDDAEVYFGRALDARKQLGEKKGIITTLNYLGNIERLRGRFDRAVARYLEAVRIAREIGSRSGEAETLEYMAAVMAAQGRYGAALESLAESRSIFEELGDKNGVAMAMLAQSKIECSLGDCSTVTDTAAEAESLAREIGNEDLVAVALLAKGSLELLAGEHESAIGHLTQAKEHAESGGGRVTLLSVTAELGHALLRAGKPDEALPVLASTSDEARRLGLVAILAKSETYRSETLLESGDADGAAGAAAEAARMAESMGDRELVVAGRCLLARASRETGGSEAAVEHSLACLEAVQALTHDLGESAELFLMRPDISAAVELAAQVLADAGKNDELKRFDSLGIGS